VTAKPTLRNGNFTVVLATMRFADGILFLAENVTCFLHTSKKQAVVSIYVSMLTRYFSRLVVGDPTQFDATQQSEESHQLTRQF
jgi:hypothetical protein